MTGKTANHAGAGNGHFFDKGNDFLLGDKQDDREDPVLKKDHDRMIARKIGILNRIYFLEQMSEELGISIEKILATSRKGLPENYKKPFFPRGDDYLHTKKLLAVKAVVFTDEECPKDTLLAFRDIVLTLAPSTSLECQWIRKIRECYARAPLTRQLARERKRNKKENIPNHMPAA